MFLGDLVDVESYNDRLGVGGEGVLPGELGPAVELEGIEGGGGSEGGRGLVVTAGPGAALASLAAVPGERFGQVVPTRRMSVGAAEPDEAEGPAAFGAIDAAGASVLMRWRADWAEAVVEGRSGRGRVLLWNTTADRAWSNWPTDPSFVLAVREGARAVAGGAPGGEAVEGAERVNRTVGEVLTVEFDPGRAVTGAGVVGPDGRGAQPVAVDRGEPVAPGEPAGAAVRYGGADRVGWYTLSWDSPGVGAGANERVFAVNPDAAESDLTPVAGEAIGAALRPLAVTVERVGGVAGQEVAEDRPLWRVALGAVLALVVLESAFAAWVGREK